MAEFIYTMRKARKAHGDKVILDDVTLAFLPGARPLSPPKREEGWGENSPKEFAL
jgi:hypothetical protein